MQNRISVTLSEADRQAVLGAFQTLNEKLSFLVDLSNEERKQLAKMGDRSVAFVLKSVEIADAGVSYLPTNFDVAEFRKDLEAHDALLPLLQRATKLQELLDDTLVLIGNDLYLAALDHYAFAKRAGAEGGLDELKSSLSKRFAGNGPAKTTTAPAN